MDDTIPTLPNEGMDLDELLDGLIEVARLAGETDAAATDEDPQTTMDCVAADGRVMAWRAAVKAEMERLTKPSFVITRTMEWEEPAETTSAAPAMPTVELEPEQDVAAGMTPEASAEAFNAVVHRYNLRSAACIRLRRSVHYSSILLAAQRGDWRTVNRLLGHAHVID